MKIITLIILIILTIYITIWTADSREYLRDIPPKYFRPIRAGTYTSLFGERQDPFRKNIGGRSRRFHYGIDIASARGSFVYAADNGIVVMSRRYYGDYGTAVMIKHPDGTFTLYGHLSVRFNRRGDHVKRGQSIGVIGSTGRSTGVHCHFEERDAKGFLVNPKTDLDGATLYL